MAPMNRDRFAVLCGQRSGQYAPAQRVPNRCRRPRRTAFAGHVDDLQCSESHIHLISSGVDGNDVSTGNGGSQSQCATALASPLGLHRANAALLIEYISTRSAESSWSVNSCVRNPHSRRLQASAKTNLRGGQAMLSHQHKLVAHIRDCRRYVILIARGKALLTSSAATLHRSSHMPHWVCFQLPSHRRVRVQPESCQNCEASPQCMFCMPVRPAPSFKR